LKETLSPNTDEVALAAIKGLYMLATEQQREIEALRTMMKANP